MPKAAETIAQEHRAITAVIDALAFLARDVANGGEPDYEVLTVLLDYVETFPNRLHHPREDRYLFSALRRGDDLTHELRYLLARCRVGGPQARKEFAAAVEQYAAFHWRHMRKEEDVLLPLARAAFTDADWAAIDAAWESDGGGGGAGFTPRREFDALFRLIVAMAPPPLGVGPTAAERSRH